MATTTIQYNNVTPSLFTSMTEAASKEFTVQVTGNSFSGSVHGGLVKARGTYDPEAKSVIVVISHPFFVPSGEVKKETDAWFKQEQVASGNTTLGS